MIGVLTIYCWLIWLIQALSRMKLTSSWSDTNFSAKNGNNITTEIKTRARHHIYGERCSDNLLQTYIGSFGSYKLLHT